MPLLPNLAPVAAPQRRFHPSRVSGPAIGASKLRRFKISRGRTQGFTLVELLVTVAVIAILASLSLAVVGQVKAGANRVTCVTNMRSLAIGIVGYAGEHDNEFPQPFGDGLAASWDGLIVPYLGGVNGSYKTPNKLLQCPEDKRPAIIDAQKFTFPRSYKMSSQPAQDQDSPMGIMGYWDDASGKTVGMSRQMNQISVPADTIMLFENFTANTITPDYIDNWQYKSGNSMGSGWTSKARVTGYRADGSKRLYHGRVMNFAMADGHVETQTPDWVYTPANRWNAIR